MTYMILLHCLHPYLLQLSFCHYSYYVIITTFYLLAEITLKLGLQSTEEYFPYIEIIPKDFPNASSMYMLLLQLSYISQRVE